MRILIAGCGYFGMRFAEDRRAEGHEVFGLTRSGGVDFLKPETLQALPPVDLVVFSQAPGPADTYADTYYKGTQNLLSVLERQMPSRAVFVSSTRVYGINDASWVDETTDPRPADDNARILLDAEKLVLDSRIPAVVMRLGGIYGPGRNRIAALKEGRLKPVLTREYTNRIRVEDAAQAVWTALRKGGTGETYIGVDDRPCTQEEFYRWLCPRLDIAVNGALPPGPETGKRCSNKKLESLGFKPKFPSFISGYEALA